MKKAAYNILPGTEEILKTMGKQIKLAVAMGIYAAVLRTLNNLDKDLLLVAKNDEMGRQLQDLNLLTRKSKTGSGLLQIID